MAHQPAPRLPKASSKAIVGHDVSRHVSRARAARRRRPRPRDPRGPRRPRRRARAAARAAATLTGRLLVAGRVVPTNDGAGDQLTVARPSGWRRGAAPLGRAARRAAPTL